MRDSVVSSGTSQQSALGHTADVAGRMAVAHTALVAQIVLPLHASSKLRGGREAGTSRRGVFTGQTLRPRGDFRMLAFLAIRLLHFTLKLDRTPARARALGG